MKKIRVKEVPEDHNEDTPESKTFFKVSVQNFVIIFRDIIGLETSYCLSTNHNPEFPCVIFALVLHFLHPCYTFLHYVTLELQCSQPIRIE